MGEAALGPEAIPGHRPWPAQLTPHFLFLIYFRNASHPHLGVVEETVLVWQSDRDQDVSSFATLEPKRRNLLCWRNRTECSVIAHGRILPFSVHTSYQNQTCQGRKGSDTPTLYWQRPLSHLHSQDCPWDGRRSQVARPPAQSRAWKVRARWLTGCGVLQSLRLPMGSSLLLL